MSYELSLIKSEYLGGPLDGDKRQPAASVEYFVAAPSSPAAYVYARGITGTMLYSGEVGVDRVPENTSLWPLHPRAQA